LYILGTEKIVLISEGLRRIFIRKGYPPSILTVIHNGIPAERYAAWSWEKVKFYKQKFGIIESDIVIGCVSRRKRQDQIIRAVATLKNPRLKIMFVGVSIEEFDDIARNLGVSDRLICTGHITGEEVLNFYKIFHINILASVTDGFGLVLLEAMALGCPVIGTDFGGIPDVIRNGENGLLFPDGDIKALAQAIRVLLEDSDLASRLTQQAIHTATTEFSIERTVDGYEKLFESLLSSRPQ
jgi:glycosyltransferase involved in cell wall biosynthesis